MDVSLIADKLLQLTIEFWGQYGAQITEKCISVAFSYIIKEIHKLIERLSEKDKKNTIKFDNDISYQCSNYAYDQFVKFIEAHIPVNSYLTIAWDLFLGKKTIWFFVNSLLGLS